LDRGRVPQADFETLEEFVPCLTDSEVCPIERVGREAL